MRRTIQRPYMCMYVPPFFLFLFRLSHSFLISHMLLQKKNNRTTDAYLVDVLDMVCRNKKIAYPKDYALLLEDLSILVPLDRTVTSLQGMKDLCIMKQALLDSLNPGLGKKPGRATDPNGQCDFFFLSC